MDSVSVNGLRRARKLIAEVKSNIKGDRSEWASGYRAGLDDLDKAIKRELNEIKPANNLPDVLK